MNLDALRTLRARCDASLRDCREALQATADDVDAALAWLAAHGRLPVVEPVSVEGLLRFQAALRGATPSEPLLRDLLALYSDHGRIRPADWPTTAPAFVRRLA